MVLNFTNEFLKYLSTEMLITGTLALYLHGSVEDSYLHKLLGESWKLNRRVYLKDKETNFIHGIKEADTPGEENWILGCFS